MVLKQRKQIKNLDSFDGGTDNNWNGNMSPIRVAAEQGAQNFLMNGSWDNGNWSKLQTGSALYGSGTQAAVNNGFSPMSRQAQNWNEYTKPMSGADMGIPKQKIQGNESKSDSSISWGNVATQSVDALKSTIAGFQNYKSSNELLADAGQTTGTINGINYQQQNYINADAELKEQRGNAVANTLDQMGKGAAVGANFPPFGAAIGATVGAISGVVGGIFSRNKLKRRLNAAERMRVRKNIFNRSTAMSEGMQQDYATEYGDPSAGLLYANRGKDIG